MQKIKEKILIIDQNIYENFELIKGRRGFISQNVLSQLRNLVEAVAVYFYFFDNTDQDPKFSYSIITKALGYIKKKSKYIELIKFHSLLQQSASHYTIDKESSERLMLKYYKHLLKLKKFLKEELSIEILECVKCFPINKDSELNKYYESISEKLNKVKNPSYKYINSSQFYIQKNKPFYINGDVFYEVTYTQASDHVSKFDRMLAFTKIDMLENYAVRLKIEDTELNVLDKKIKIKVITDYSVSIRACEFKNLSIILGLDFYDIVRSKEYDLLMYYLTINKINLLDLILLSDSLYYKKRNYLVSNLKNVKFFKILDMCRDIIISEKRGCIILRYIMHNMCNKIIKSQIYRKKCNKLSDLYLNYGCIPFEEMPYASSLMNHNPKISDIIECIPRYGRDHELFARSIQNNTLHNGILYTNKSNFENDVDFSGLMSRYNSMLYYTHKNRTIEEFKNYFFIRGFEDDTIFIIKSLMEKTSIGIKNYSNSFESWHKTSMNNIDCPEKIEILRSLFEKSKVAFIYGAAGTGKTTLINHISTFYSKNSKMFLANTNPAVENMKRKIDVQNSTFTTISKLISSNVFSDSYDLLIIDECSTVSNSDLKKVLTKIKFELIILVGDVYQIESILFGNWFDSARFIFPQTVQYELTRPYRTQEVELLDLWKSVRNLENDILEKLIQGEFTQTLNDSIFNYKDDEIILCLNYDGFYGINNINNILQSSNDSDEYIWEGVSYKINDPILFNDSKRFHPLIYNNLKGIIKDIKINENSIEFSVEIDKVINEMDILGMDIELLDYDKCEKSIVKFAVFKNITTDDDNYVLNCIVPFQIAYAISIHKAQGLEYKSVKIVITDEVDELISHNIFYTAITRARKNLKIFWSPETESKVLECLEKKDNRKDVNILRGRIS